MKTVEIFKTYATKDDVKIEITFKNDAVFKKQIEKVIEIIEEIKLDSIESEMKLYFDRLESLNCKRIRIYRETTLMSEVDVENHKIKVYHDEW